MSDIIKPQRNPVEGREIVANYVLADIEQRIKDGEAKYGTPLMTFNGRNALWDAYQEALDLVFYLRQHIIETAPPNYQMETESGRVQVDPQEIERTTEIRSCK